MVGTVIRCADRVALTWVLDEDRDAGRRIAFVPTMGALHAGHRTLIERAASLAPTVVVSIFVNPTQFDAATDLATYPRTLDADLELLDDLARSRDARIVVYVPSVDDVYPEGPSATLHVPEVTEHLCGASRPGHFDGVATVVDALLRAVRPTILVMGRKDHQQLVVVRRMVEQQGHPVAVDAAPLVRAQDAVAVSSRNALLDTRARAIARRIPCALAAGVAVVRSARSGATLVEPAAIRAAAADELAHEGLQVDYLETVDPDRIVPLDAPHDPADLLLLAVAVHVRMGERTVRLIDNVLLGDVDDEQRLLDALVRAG